MRAWAEKYLGFYKALLTVFVRGARYLLAQFMQKSITEKVFILGVISLILLLSAPWRAYEIRFPDQPVFTHGIFTDDFIWYFLADILLAISVLNLDLATVRILRIAGLAITVLFVVLTLISPTRIAPTAEAAFTWQFYVFAIANAVVCITGIPGIVSYAQNSFRN